VRRILKELPESLDETYERVLREIRKANQGHAYRLLQCLVVAVRPLHVEELAEVLAVNFEVEGTPILNPSWQWSDHQEAVLSACSSLVTIIKDKDGDSRIVQFSHFSVKEYLTSNRLAESSRDVSRYHIQLTAAHTILAQACLGVLLRLDGDIDRDRIKNFPLARYAGHYWVQHAQFENVSSRIEEGMDRLFDGDKPHFSTWLWIDDGENSLGYSPTPTKPEAVPLYYAALHGFRDLVERLLVKHPEDLRAEGGYWITPLRASCEGRHFDIFSILIDHFPDGNIPAGYSLAALHLASSEGLVEIGQRLLDRGADVNTRTDNGWTPLCYAGNWGQLESAQMLIQHGADIDSQSDDGETPMHIASKHGYVKVVKFLLEKGANISLRDKDSRTPSELASFCYQLEVVQLLSEHLTKSMMDS
jgi:hypothetical protein